MRTEDLRAMIERADAATPGPWVFYETDSPYGKPIYTSEERA